MALVLADRVRETTTTAGTGTITLLGAVPSCQSFAVVGNGNTTYYTIVAYTGTEYEVGIGTYTSSGTTLSRDTVLASSNGGSLVNFSAGTKDVFVDYPAGRAVYEDAAGNVDGYPITGGTINNTTIGATTPTTGVFTTLTATGQTSLGGVAGAESLIVNAIAGSTRWIEIAGSVSGNTSIRTRGAGNPSFQFVNRGTGPITFSTADSLSNEQFRVSNTASAVNYVQVTGAATGNSPLISAQGSDTNVNITVQGKGTGSAILLANSTGSAFLQTDGGLTAIRAMPRGASGDTWLDVQRTSGLVALSASSGVTNGAFLVQSKGTGAIDLAAGSSGVNISNGGTVTAITRTANGSYTSMPTAVISAPTTAGGTQATLSPLMAGSTATVVAGGTGYTVGDTLTIVGATGTASQFIVATLSGSAVATVTFTTSGSMSALPSNPVSVTGGTGSGATFNMTYSLAATQSSFTAGSGYVEQPTVTFSGGGGSGAAAYATVGSGSIIRSLGLTGTQSLSFFTPSGEAVRIRDTGSVGAYSMFSNTAAGTTLVTQGAANAFASFNSNGTGSVLFGTNGNSGNTQMTVSHTASAVNYVQVTGAATGGTPTISAQGSDANVGMLLQAKGARGFTFQTRGGGTPRNAFVIADSGAASVNYFQSQSSLTGFGPVLSAQGSDTNINAVVQPKGTGALQAQQTDSTATGGNARGANAVDWQTSRSTAAMVASGQYATVSGGYRNTASGFSSTVSGGETNSNSGYIATISGGATNTSSGSYTAIAGGYLNTNSKDWSFLGAGYGNTAGGFHNFIGSGYSNSGTSASAVTTQSATMNGTTAVTLSGSNASIKVGQLITGTSIANFPNTYVAAISGTSLTLSQAASGSSTSTLSFFTPHGVVVGGGNNQATGSYSFIGGGGDAGTSTYRNVASGDWGTVVGGRGNYASGIGSFVGGGGTDGTNIFGNIASGTRSAIIGGWNNIGSGGLSVVGGGQSNQATNSFSSVLGGSDSFATGAFSSIAGGSYGTTRGITGNQVFPACQTPIAATQGVSQAALLVLGNETLNATPVILRSNSAAASTTNQVILPNNSAYYFKGSVIANVTGAANGAAWSFEGAIMRGANAASTVLMGTPAINRVAATAGATAWAIAITADTTNGGLAVTVTGAASTTIRWVCSVNTTECTF